MRTQIKFIGTGSGKTSLKRFHSSILIKTENNNLLIDCGDSTSKALKSAGVQFQEINTILFSHFHADHFAGIASLITQMKLEERFNPLTIYTPPGLKPKLTSFLNSTYMFREILDFELTILEFQFENRFDITDAFGVLPHRNSHIENKHKLKGYGDVFNSASFLFNLSGKNIFYTADIGSTADLDLIPDQTDILIIETTHIPLQKIQELTTQKQNVKIILTHISDEDEDSIENLCEEDQSGNLIIAYDELTIPI
ncbi:MAG: MBL fold metallo-hydrolase [Melioribacteraceae bacterium]|nr:MBL fold metallo-hydrolase [Melioribacteraceae bacterium]MCF8263241.1 MBL fold metallo-hydrolase [Melioribacteraceae bacterium]MCF8412215.1 MBL fold metallo-hydrolase [Melioribacteraceae bacterium]MCF8432304.1 MBL fold metallo-hydrolase [Melioribacteraceae bacterium]